ncbi:hypothetical protein [Streptomyces longwoodensis]|uniref:nuclear transport factor 2 family protein n=1 Tax=Streptomyces longwoodensis TaxID=68231 RepID=UPI002DDBF5BF|nr:hypothetical protein [Streptomyces longwoodensis]
MSAHQDSTTELLERFYDAEAHYVAAGGPGRAAFDSIARCLDPDVTLHQAPGLPYSGVWQGPEGIERFMAVMGEMWEPTGSGSRPAGRDASWTRASCRR